MCCFPSRTKTTTASAISSRPILGALLQAQIQIINYHTFLPQDAKEIQGVANNTRKLLRGGRPEGRRVQGDARRWSPRACCVTSAGRGEIVVLNDEAHHCYQDRLLEHPGEKADKEDQERNRERGSGSGVCPSCAASRDQGRLRPLRDALLPQGLGLQRGLHFPVDGQRLLADGRDRVGDRKGAPHASRRRRRWPELVYLRLWDYVRPPLPKRKSARTRGRRTLGPAKELEGALQSLYRANTRTTLARRRSWRRSARRRQ